MDDRIKIAIKPLMYVLKLHLKSIDILMNKSIYYDIVWNENNFASDHIQCLLIFWVTIFTTYPFHIIDSLQNILFLFHKNLKAVPEKVQTLFVLQGHSK